MLGFNTQLLLGNRKWRHTYFPAQLFGGGNFSVFELSARSCMLALASGVDLCRAEKLRGWDVHGQGRSRAAGVRTAGFGPEPDRQCVEFTRFAHGKMIKIIILCGSRHISLRGRQSDPWAALSSTAGYKLLSRPRVQGHLQETSRHSQAVSGQTLDELILLIEYLI